MPVVTSVPGVYIEEVPSGVRTITGVATSVTAFVGRAQRGPVDEPVRCFGFADFERRFGGLWAAAELGYAVQQFFSNGGGEAVVSRVADGATAATATVAGTTTGTLALAAAEPGGWGAALRVSVSHGTAGRVDATTGDTAFHLTIDEIDPAVAAVSGYDAAVITRETFPFVSVDPTDPRFVTQVVAQASRLAQVTGVPLERPVTATRTAFTGGSDGTTGGADIPAYAAAIGRLDQVDVINLLCVPPVDRNTPTHPDTWAQALAWARRRRAVLLVDPPDGWADAQAAADLAGGFDGLRDPNSAFYFPRVLAADPLQQNLPRPFAPSAAVAGVLARTDAERGIWKAPAGTEATLAGVTGFELALTDDDSSVLNPRGVNALRDLSVVGPVVWGARTGRGADAMASEWKYLPVRRLALHIENSLDLGTRWAVFEGNAEPLWSQLRLSIGTFLHDLFRAGAFAGSTPREAYLVRCDASTTTPTDVATGRVNVLVGFAPLKPAEFVILTFQQMAGQASA